MDPSMIREYFVSLTPESQNNLLSELQDLKDISDYGLLEKHVKERFTESEFIERIIELSVDNTKAIHDYRDIDKKYEELMNLS